MSRRAWRRWAWGLLGAVINSAAGATAVVIVDPVDFNLFAGGAWKLAQVATVLGIVGAGLYLKEHRLPVEDEAP